jgi:hypothetical protein
MSLEEKLKPINKEHSIKEAVIGLFLATPIVKPSRFQELIEKEFSSIFQQFEPLAQFQFQVKPQPGNLNIQPGPQNDVGFKFTSFKKGTPEKILQGFNDSGNSRNFISYHTLNYTRWDT